MKTFIKKIILKIFSFANKDLSLKLDSLYNCFRDVKTEFLNQNEEALTRIRNQNEEALTRIRNQNEEALTRISEIKTSFSQIQDTLNRLEASQKTLETKQVIFEVQSHYKYIRSQIIEKISHGEKLRFGSYVVYDTTFGAHGIVDLMLKEPERYDVKFVICPDTYRDMDGLKQYHKTKQFFIERYGADRVLDGYDEKTGEFLDLSDSFDVVYMANPYDVLVNRVHGIRYLSGQNVLPIFICYGFTISKWLINEFHSSLNEALLYKNFVETKVSKMEISESQLFYQRNMVVSGYSKMDELFNIPQGSQSRKKILIAPHHTVKGLPGELQYSNFLEYSDFILELPDLFPDTDFIFRPHPLLFKNLAMHKIWSQEKIDQFLSQVNDKKIEYSKESDYLHLFKECDAIIHDCGSFSVEWLYTGKPCCYVVDSEDRVRKQFNRLGNVALDCHTTIADSKKEILKFIKKVENNEYPNIIDERVKNEIMINYPNCSEFILNNLLK